MKSARRKTNELRTLAHFETLWRTALWLTLRKSLAENLVLRTMTRGYQERHDSDELVSERVRLFRILTREFFGRGKQRRRWDPPGSLSENRKSTARSEWRIPLGSNTAIEHAQLLQLNMLSDYLLKGAIARLRPRSRLIMILLFRERFSYADIAYIMDISRNSVKTILTRLRAAILSNVLENVEDFGNQGDSHSAFPTNSAQSDRDPKRAFLHVPFIFPQESPAESTFDRWENEGGALRVRSPGFRLCSDSP